MKQFLRRAWAEIHLDRLRDNFNGLKKLTGSTGTQIACVVKANAYGHDDENIVPFLQELGASFFAVSNIKEAEKVRRCGRESEILILGHTPSEYAGELAENDIIQAAVSEEYARELSDAAVKSGVKVKIHLAVDANGMPVRILITEGTRADCKEAIHLIDGISAETLLADRGYDTNQIIAYAADAGINIVIPAKRNRKQQREYDRYLYRLRHLVENAFLHLKRWRGVATRYAKTTTSFLAAVQIRCIAIWCAILA